MDLKIYTVSNLNKYIKMVIDNDQFLNNVAIKGEITNFKAHSSGHLYFTLKDELSTIKCVMFKNSADKLNINLEDGVKVIAVGQISVYEAGGSYQVYVKQLTLEGIGDLFKKYEELKKKLKREGLFEETNKKKLSFLPKRVGIITSPTGSVIRDIINVSTRRFFKPNLVIYPATVQGEKTASSVIKAIKTFNERVPVDVIIIARGGGSFEDLFGFNDEELAREIFKSKIPIVSAVGHETDFTICDFVADMRAPTPSAAAEIVFPSSIEINEKISMFQSRIQTAMKNNLLNKKKYLDSLRAERLERNLRDLISKHRMMNDNFRDAMEIRIKNKLKESRQMCISKISLLDSFSPLKTLARGYSVVQNLKGKVVLQKTDIKIGENINIRVIDGKLIAKVENII